MDGTAELVRSNKGGLKLIHRGYLYTVHKRRSGGSIRWRCTQRSMHCRGSVTTNRGVTKINAAHNHLPDIHSAAVAKARNMVEDDIIGLEDENFDNPVEMPRLVKQVSRQATPTALSTNSVNNLNLNDVGAPQQEEEGEEVCIRWNSHHNNMKSTFPCLLQREQYVDVTLTSEGKNLKCHKLILSSCSTYFEELLAGIEPYQHPVIFLNGVPFWLLKAILDFMYAGEVHIDQNKLPQLLKVAQMLQIKGLTGKDQKAEEQKPEETTPVPQQTEKIETPPPTVASATPSQKIDIQPSSIAKIPDGKQVPIPKAEFRSIILKPTESKAPVPIATATSPPPLEKISNEVKKIPAEVKKTPAEVKKIPVESKKVPVDVKKIPVDVKKVPVEVKRAPIEVKKIPVEVKEMPQKIKEITLPGMRQDELPRLRVVPKKDVPFALTKRSIVFKAIPVLSSNVDPMSLLKTAFIENAGPDGPKILKGAKESPKKVAPVKKMKKRKLSENTELSPPPVVYRKGTKSRPNVKVPRYYHNDYDFIMKKKMLKREFKETLERSKVENTAFDLSNIKSEPLDIEDTDVQFMEITTEDGPEESDLSRDFETTSSTFEESNLMTETVNEDSSEGMLKMEKDPIDVNGENVEEILPSTSKEDLINET